MTLDIAEELNRKSLEALQQVMVDHGCGAISGAQARVALATLFNTVSGLAGSDVFQLISEASEQLRRDASAECVRKELFVDEYGGVVQLEYHYGQGELLVKTRQAGERRQCWTNVRRMTFESEVLPFEAAKVRMDEYAASLLRRGYERLD